MPYVGRNGVTGGGTHPGVFKTLNKQYCIKTLIIDRQQFFNTANHLPSHSFGAQAFAFIAVAE